MTQDWVRDVASGLIDASVLVLFAAVATDVVMRRVPNILPALLALAGLGLHALDGSLLPAVGLAAIVFAGSAVCWQRGWMGGADVKLLAAAALLVAPRLVPDLMLMIALAGGALALCYLAARRLLPEEAMEARPAGTIARLWQSERIRIHQGQLPYAVAIAAGTLAILIR